MTVYETGADGLPAHCQPHRHPATWVLPGSPFVDAAAAAASAVPIATTAVRVRGQEVKHS